MSVLAFAWLIWRSFLVFAITTRATCGSRIRVIASVLGPASKCDVIVRAEALREQLKLLTRRRDTPSRPHLAVFGRIATSHDR